MLAVIIKRYTCIPVLLKCCCIVIRMLPSREDYSVKIKGYLLGVILMPLGVVKSMCVCQKNAFFIDTVFINQVTNSFSTFS